MAELTSGTFTERAGLAQCGLRPNARQIREIADCDIPLAVPSTGSIVCPESSSSDRSPDYEPRESPPPGARIGFSAVSIS